MGIEIMKIGRPETYTEEYLEKEAEELLKFKGESLYEFTYDKPYLAQHLTVFAQRSVPFKLALNKVKERIAHNRTRMYAEGTLPSIAYQRSQHVYDKITLDVDEAIKDRDSERRKKENSTVPKNDQQFDDASEVIRENHALRKELEELKKKSQA